MIDPKRFQAFVVGIEKYAGGPRWDLNGPAHDALAFAAWLIARGVPHENISAFLAPLPGSTPFQPFPDLREKIAVHDARSATLLDAFEKVAKAKPRHFCLYWGGHGFVTQQDRHFLQSEDAHRQGLRSLDLQNLSAFLNSDAFGPEGAQGLRESILIVDACATFAELRGFDRYIAPQLLPPGEPRKRRHCTLFATDNGSQAKNLSDEGTGLFSRELRKRLAQETSLDALLTLDRTCIELRDRFKALPDRDHAAQTPTYLRIGTFDGDEERWGQPGTAELDLRYGAYMPNASELARLNGLAASMQPPLALATVRERYRKTVRFDEAPPVGDDGVECFQTCAIELARRMSESLFTFLELCREDFEAAGLGEPLAEWVRSVAGRTRTKIENALAQARELRGEKSATRSGGVVQMIVEPLFGFVPGSEQYQMRAVVTVGGKQGETRLVHQANARATEIKALRAQVPDLFATALNDFDERDGIQVEAILPAELLPQGVEGWEWIDGPESAAISSEYTVALRSYERHYVPAYQQARMRQKSKWKRLGDGFVPCQVVWHEGDHMPTDEMFRQWSDMDVLALCALTLSFGKPHHRRGVERFINAGIPLGVWFPQSHGGYSRWRELIDQFFGKAPRDEWRARARKLHRTPPESCPLPCHSLSLMWDNPDQPPPPLQGWNDAPLRAPS
jgi:hypothetical protein